MDLKESFFSINQQHQTGVARLHANCHAQKWFKGQKGQKLEFAELSITTTSSTPWSRRIAS
ncbi:MAG: hypothetical protein IJ151_07220 [Bacteroidales bacterium]|nr:hypothetical protein [Bacteroidales bacterium]